MLDPTQKERYSRFISLRDVTDSDMEKILSSKVTVVGAGGLGSPVLRLLTALGFGEIRIIDHDLVDLSNLQRQTIYETDDIGSPKAETAAANLSKLNPDVKLEPFPISIRDDNAVDLIEGSDVVLDGLDSITARRAVNKASVSLGIPYVYAGAIEYYGNLSTFVPGTTGCLHCLIGDLEDESVATCSDVGVTPTLLSIIGAIEVEEALRIVRRKTPLFAGRLLHVDVQTMTLDSFNLEQSKSCPICSKPSASVKESNKEPLVTMLCSGSFTIAPSEMTKLDLEAVSRELDPTYSCKLKKKFLKILIDEKVTMTLMRTGNAVVNGVHTKEDALRIYKDVMS